MTPPVHPEVEGCILQLSQMKLSSFMIQKELEKSKILVTVSTINHFVKKNKENPNKETRMERPAQLPRIRLAGTSAIIKKVKFSSATANPPTQRAIATCLGVLKAVVNRIIHKNLGADARRKTAVHFLTVLQMPVRKERALAFAACLENE